MCFVFGGTGGLCSSRALGEVKIPRIWLQPGEIWALSSEPWEVAILGGPGWDEQAIQGEARVFFHGCVCLCVGKRDWVREWGR